MAISGGPKSKRHLEYLFEHNLLSTKDILLSEFSDTTGNAIANKLGLTYNGWWEELGKYTFTDKVTGSTFLAKDEPEAILKLKKVRKSFGK